jgi:general secretion pathway protein G
MKKNYHSHDRNHGFTLMELLIVMVLLGILALIGMPTFQGTQRKSRDGKRKADLVQIGKSLEMYANDTSGIYPTSSGGKIVGCGGSACEWGAAFANGSTVYMQKLPKDPVGSQYYYYEPVGSARKSYRLWARLENTDDSDITTSTLTCGSGNCNYVVRSSNLIQ